MYTMKLLGRILGIALRDHNRNKCIKQALNVEKTIIDIIRKKRIARSCLKIAYKEDLVGKRQKDRPWNLWCDQLKSDTSLPLLTAERLCQTRDKWKKFVNRNVARLLGVCK